MGTMTQLLTEVCGCLPTGDIYGSSSSQSPLGTGQECQRRRSISPSSDESSEHKNEPRCKSRREDNSISVHATDDVEQLLAEQSVCATAPNKPNVVGKDELLKELVASLQDKDTKGPKVQQQLVDISIKRWGNKLHSDKMTRILGKYQQPENCKDMAIAWVNPKI